MAQVTRAPSRQKSRKITIYGIFASIHKSRLTGFTGFERNRRQLSAVVRLAALRHAPVAVEKPLLGAGIIGEMGNAADLEVLERGEDEAAEVKHEMSGPLGRNEEATGRRIDGEEGSRKLGAHLVGALCDCRADRHLDPSARRAKIDHRL